MAGGRPAELKKGKRTNMAVDKLIVTALQCRRELLGYFLVGFYCLLSSKQTAG